MFWLKAATAILICSAIIGVLALFIARVGRRVSDDLFRDPYLDVHGDQPNAPWAAKRSATERLEPDDAAWRNQP